MTKSISAFTWKDAMKYRYEIFGVAAIWILFYHIYNNVGGSSFFPLKVLFRAISIGNMGVDIFLFLSSIGLYASMQKNDVESFYINRIKRVLIPYLVISTPYYIWYNFIQTYNGMWGFIGDITTANFWLTGDHPVWYVAFIIIMYALFPLIYKFDVKTKHISTVCLVFVSVVSEYLLYASGSWLFDNAEKAFSRIPIFLVGVLIAPRVLKGTRIGLWTIITACVLGSGLFALICVRSFDIVLIRYIYGIVSVCAVIAYGFFRNLIDIGLFGKILAWAGGISLEIYIVHVLLLRTIKYNEWWGVMHGAFWFILIPIVTLIFAKLISILCSKVYLLKKFKLVRRG